MSEHGPELSEGQQQLNVVPADDELKSRGVENCILVERDASGGVVGSADDVVGMAMRHKAFIENNDEAGDDLYAVQIDGHQKLVEYDDLLAEFRNEVE